MNIIKYKTFGKTISKSNIEEKLETYLKTSKIGFEIEGNASVDTSEDGCDDCDSSENLCLYCDIPDDWTNCPHFRSSNYYCEYYRESVCGGQDNENISDGSLTDVFQKYLKNWVAFPHAKMYLRKTKNFFIYIMMVA